MASSEKVFYHSTLQCSLRGKASPTSVQFRNIKYASVPARFRDSLPHGALKVGSDGVFDATKFGPSCPHKRGGQAWDLGLYGDVTLPCEMGQGETEEMDEFECLHVNVTIPKPGPGERESSGKSLPVFVWVHGGGLSVGSNNWPQYDLQRFVDRSVEIGKPVVAVAMNYRLGLFGFMAKEELGAPGNMGFKDQVLAFRWVKNHIAGFGGDPDNITAAGNSAGGISLSTLLCADVGEKGLFKKVVIMSGETTLRNPRNKWWHEKMYADQAKNLGLSTTDTASLRHRLLNTEAVDLAQQLPFAAHYCGFIDETFLKQNVTPNLISNPHHPIHNPTWCDTFIIGDTTHDGTILQARILDAPDAFARLTSACRSHLTSSETSRLLHAYNLDATSSSSPEHERATLLVLASELRFYEPARRAHAGWEHRNAGRYHFHVPNPFSGAYTGLASHELDVAYLLQNFNGVLDERNRGVARAMADRFVAFVSGEAWAAEGNVLVFDGEGVKEVDEGMYDEVYRQGRGEILGSIDAGKLWRVAEMWQGVRSEVEEGESGFVARI
jgi:carboxylesterase type B